MISVRSVKFAWTETLIKNWGYTTEGSKQPKNIKLYVGTFLEHSLYVVLVCSCALYSLLFSRVVNIE